jgi:predicted porin
MKMKLRNVFLMALALAITVAFTMPAGAGVTVYKKDDKILKIGGRIMVQYHLVDEDTGTPGDDTTDEVFLRRFRTYIEGSIHKDWKGKFQIDTGQAGRTATSSSANHNEVAVKDAYFIYSGFKEKGVNIRFGNANFPFSQEKLTSSKKQQLVERTFVGDHNWGTPDRNVHLMLSGKVADKKVGWAVAVGQSDIDPDDDKLDFDTTVNRNHDFNEGWIAGFRLDYHPYGTVKYSQGDFKREESPKVRLAVAAFFWNNDGDNNTYTSGGVDTGVSDKNDIDEVVGYEISGAVRWRGVSIDAQYNLFEADTVDPNFTSNSGPGTGGLYENGETDLEQWVVEGGYMVIPSSLELVAGYQWQDADNYATEWTRTSFGANLFVKKHDIKLVGTYRIGEDLDGIKGKDADELFVQAQYVF